MSKFYFSKTEDNLCFQLDYYKEYLADHELDEIILEEARIEYNNGFFYCIKVNVSGETIAGDCGAACKFYKPRNNKNGRCMFSRNTYAPTGKFFKLTKDGILTKVKEMEQSNLN